MTTRPPLRELGLNTGKKARLNRILFQHGLRNGTALFLPYDQGLEHGPRDFFANPAASDPAYITKLALTGGFNGIAIQIGLAEKFYWDYAGEVPLAVSDLVRLPGVGRKTANVAAAERGATQGIVVDTHVRRLSQRLGLTRHDDPAKIERDLQRVVPRADWARLPHLLIRHGRRVCTARAPRCETCVLADLCPAARVDVVTPSAQLLHKV